MTAPAGFRLRRLRALEDPAVVRDLAAVLVDAVEGGASVSFLSPLSQERAEAFWRTLAPAVASGARALVVAEGGGRIVGTVQVVLAQPENQPHRAEVVKMLVHRSARRRGIGAALLAAAEEAGRAAGKTLLVLDTAEGSDAERLYARLGWRLAGKIPAYALWPDGKPCATSIFWKALR